MPGCSHPVNSAGASATSSYLLSSVLRQAAPSGLSSSSLKNFHLNFPTIDFHKKGCDKMLEDVKPELTALKEKLNEMGNSL